MEKRKITLITAEHPKLGKIDFKPENIKKEQLLPGIEEQVAFIRANCKITKEIDKKLNDAIKLKKPFTDLTIWAKIKSGVKIISTNKEITFDFN